MALLRQTLEGRSRLSLQGGGVGVEWVGMTRQAFSGFEVFAVQGFSALQLRRGGGAEREITTHQAIATSPQINHSNVLCRFGLKCMLPTGAVQCAATTCQHRLPLPHFTFHACAMYRVATSQHQIVL